MGCILLGTCSKRQDECVSGCTDVAGYGAQSVPARLNALTHEDEWEARTMMPGIATIAVLRDATPALLTISALSVDVSAPAVWLSTCAL